MFTGIIEQTGIVRSMGKEGSSLSFVIQCPFANELKVDQSVSHNGVCLTVTSVSGDQYEVIAVEETLKRTNLGQLQPGDRLNLERCMKLNGRFDGHIVQGHVDGKAGVLSKNDKNGSHDFCFRLEAPHGGLIVEKGSVTVNGVSLTVVSCTADTFCVTIIPYTLENTTFGSLGENDVVNIEFDIIGKYVKSMIDAGKAAT